MSTFTDTQRTRLLEPIQPFRVQQLDGISHLAAWDVVAHLNRVFGFEGWDKQILSLEPVYEHVGTRELGHTRNCNRRDCNCRTRSVPACSVGYRCTMRLTVRNPDGEVVRVIEDAAMGTATNQRDLGDAHDLAVKSAVSYALKRCAKDLGDQFGLSLYNKGQETACVQVVWPYGDEAAELDVAVHADGIAEGDDGFGANRGESWAEGTPAEPEPVREPAPARPAKPAATPPPAPPAPAEVSAQQAQDWHAAITAAEEITPEEKPGTLRAIWREIQTAGGLDALVHDPVTGRQMALRELLVRRVAEIEMGTGASA